MTTFVERLKELRKQKNISQAELAPILGLSQQAIAKWETEKSSPDPEMLSKLADFFDVTSDYLLGRTDNPKGYYTQTMAAHRTDDPTSPLPEEARKSIEDFKRFIFEKYGIKYN